MIKKLFISILSIMIIIVSCSKNNPNNPDNVNNNDNKYDTLFLKFTIDDKTVPTFTFFEDDGKAPNGTRKWKQSHDGTNTCYIYNAPDDESIDCLPYYPEDYTYFFDLEIYVYKGINPFKTKVENDIEKQFYFYRYIGRSFTPKNNFLIAVDTKTGLLFPYAVPEKWEKVLPWLPNGWISAELGITGKYATVDQQETFTAYKFWQYDPIGKVNDDGTVTLEQFYTDAITANDYKPRYTGTSPYKDIQ